MESTDARDAQEHGWRDVDAINAAYRQREIDRAEWHDRMRALIEPAYLSAATLEAGSGHSGTPEWEATRKIVMEAVDRDGSFLDVGCANGLLMESVHRWALERGRTVEPFGVDISAALIELARRRLPHWTDRLWVANAYGWTPPRRFTFVRTAIEYVPDDRLLDYLGRLMADAVEPGGRLIVGKQNELRSEPSIAERLIEEGWTVGGSVQRPHEHPDVRYTVSWVDQAASTRALRPG